VDQVIAKIKKDGRNELWVRVGDYKGTPRIDVRLHFLPEDGKGEWVPTRKGVSIPTKLFQDLLPLVEGLEDLNSEGEVGALNLGDAQELRVGVRKFAGRVYAEFRVYARKDRKDDGEWIPTYRGVTFGIKRIPEMVEAMEAVRSHLDERE
jgi:hypothetical protein